MKYDSKANLNALISKDELNRMLESNVDSVIWSQNVMSKKVITKLIFYVFGYGSVIVYYFFIYLKIDIWTLIKEDIVLFVDGLSILFPAVFLLVLFSWNAWVAATIEYSIRPKAIHFKWGFFGRKNVSIPFYDIVSINHVQYDHGKYSTIYFGTKSIYKIKKLDFDNAESRAHITFEKVEDGEKVMELLQFLWNKERTKDTNSF